MTAWNRQSWGEFPRTASHAAGSVKATLNKPSPGPVQTSAHPGQGNAEKVSVAATHGGAARESIMRAIDDSALPALPFTALRTSFAVQPACGLSASPSTHLIWACDR